MTIDEKRKVICATSRIEQAVATLLDVLRSKISQEELDRLSQLIEEA